MKFKLALLAALSLASVNAMACYTVYDRANRIVYNSQTAPVDMTRPISETVPTVFPGGTMIFDLSSDCPRDPPSTVALTPVPPSKPSPLLTDRRTADALKLPHTILPSGVALVSNPPALRAGVTVVASAAASPAPALMAPAMTAPRYPRNDVVITELHNPPLTVVQQGGMVISELR